MEMLLTQLGSIIKQARIEEGLTQAQLAERADISTRYLMDIENKNDIPSLKVFISLVRAMRLPLDPLLYPNTESTEKLTRLLSQCNDKQLAVITAMAETMIDVDF
ncbi:MAG: helix-turn-helix domain-containing protein [Hungatella sp.]|jgi:transcriptional regulator with XRE-family HTH domain|nr:helix-turn-helix domain-containing protein [Hungatella sp.]